MHIRQLTETDVEIFRALRLRCLRESPHAFTNSYEEFSHARWTASRSNCADTRTSRWARLKMINWSGWSVFIAKPR